MPRSTSPFNRQRDARLRKPPAPPTAQDAPPVVAEPEIIEPVAPPISEPAVSLTPLPTPRRPKVGPR